jgi:glc operon protein GlcG
MKGNQFLGPPHECVILGQPMVGQPKEIGGWKQCHSLWTKLGPSAHACDHAAELGVQVTVAIVDGGGHLQVLDRMDGAPPLSARIAPAKASSVALFRRDGSELARLHQAWPALFAQLDHVAGAPVMAGAGSRLIRRDDVVIGAIAVSGAAPEQDDECADVGVGEQP